MVYSTSSCHGLMVAEGSLSQTADTVLASDVHKNIFQGGDEGVWLSGSHTLSHLSTEGLNLEVSRDQLSLFLESPAGVTLTGVSPWQQTSGVPDSQELHSGDTLLSVEREEGEGEGKRERKVHIRRNMSMPLANPSHIAMATLLDHDSDDVIAVPVRSSAPTTRYMCVSCWLLVVASSLSLTLSLHLSLSPLSLCSVRL